MASTSSSSTDAKCSGKAFEDILPQPPLPFASSSSSSTDAKGRGKDFHDILTQQLLPSASSSSSSMVYDVFLNHHGCDVAEGLAKHVYHALNYMGLRVFDKEVLQYGILIQRERENAIRSASLGIVIFSPKYAESSSCLDELSFMVKNNCKIIPIFYSVQPSDLRWAAQGKGVYASVFSQHEEKGRYTPQKLEEWKTVLYKVSFFLGYELKNEEDEGQLLKTIVNLVLKDMQIVSLEVARHPVGLDEIVDDFKKSVFKFSDRDQHVNIVGIVGMGGSGKTTLAKELYNRECLNFDRRCFMSDVRDAAAKNILHNLQGKLLQDLIYEGFNLSPHNVIEGKAILRTRLRSLRVLIVLDDVDDVDQIDALLPEKSIFAAGSLILMTTRDLYVLQSVNCFCIYKMKALNRFHANELFCWYAFLQSDPVQEFEDLVAKALYACQGLPLSLTVLGGQLYKRPKDYWVSQLEKISRRILPVDIVKRLKISFDALDREEKEMFLDTACFFLGEEKTLAIEVWNGSGWRGSYGWETLLNKCLVELDQQNLICMHDLLRDMGRQIAMECAPYRLFPSTNLDIWRLVQERRPIRGIMETSTDRSHGWHIAKPSLDYRPLVKEWIEVKPSICQVQLLVATNISEEYATLSKELRWLRLFKFQHSCLPSWLSLENLRVLELYGAPDLEELWQDNMQPPLQLRELVIHLEWQKSFQRFPRSIGRLWHLKKLSCRGARYLKNLPEEFCNLQSMEHLELQNLGRLSSLPICFGDLTNLRHLSLISCSKLKMFPDSFKQLKHLEYLDLEGCSNLTFTEHSADIFKNIAKLEYLSFNGCEGLQVLPHHITKQAFLRVMDLEGTSLRELPSSIGQLERLEVLKIGSEKLESLPDSLGNLSRLTRLKIDSCEKVRSLPESLGHLAHLESIEIFSTGVRSLPKAFGHLISLQTLSIHDSPIIELFFEFKESSSLPRLRIIFLERTRMSTVSITEDSCPSLEALSLSDEDCLEEIRTLPRTVKTITLEDCQRLKDIAGIGSLRNLQRLTVKRCPKLAELPSFAEFASMKEIEIRECQIIGKMEGIEQLRSLETLEVDTRWEVPGITSLEHAHGLRRLRLSADNIGALEPSMRTLQKLPGEVIICTRALGGVESLVKAFTAFNLMVVEACADGDDGAEETERNDDVDDEADKDDEDDEEDEDDDADEDDENDEDDGDDEADDDEDDGDDEADEDGCTLKYRKMYWSVQSYKSGKWRLKYPKACLSHHHEQTIVCFVINCLSEEGWASVWAEEKENLCNIKLREGIWVLMHVSRNTADVERDLEIHLDEGNRVENGLLATGKEREVKDVFYQGLDALKL